MTIHGISVLTYNLFDFRVVDLYRYTAAHHVTTRHCGTHPLQQLRQTESVDFCCLFHWQALQPAEFLKGTDASMVTVLHISA